jgi:hypothetical protein
LLSLGLLLALLSSVFLDGLVVLCGEGKWKMAIMAMCFAYFMVRPTYRREIPGG